MVDGRREIALARWGLVPGWPKDLKIGAKCINARAETVADRPAFRSAFHRRRCLIPADGFYEWKQLEDGSKQLYRLCLADRRPFSFAGLWERNDRLDVTKLQHHRHRAEHDGGGDPRPDAGDPPGLRCLAVARHGAGAHAVPATTLRGRDDRIAGQQGRRLAEER